MSIERVFARRDKWLRGNPDQKLPETVSTTLTETLPTGWRQDRSFWEAFSRLYPQQTKRLVSEAESILSGKLKLFQWKEIELSKPIRWSATMEPDQPEAEWPQIYYADIAVYHDPMRPERDVKWCWELNRFQHLLCLGTAWRLTRKESFAQEAREHLASWMDSIHYPVGVQWNSNLEVGLRLLAWVRCHVLCADSAAWDDEFVTRFVTCVYIHSRHLARELTVHHAPGNHLLGEASALFYVSVLYPFFVDSAKWRNDSVRILNRLVPIVILRDGVYAEQSTGYFRFVAEFLLPVIHLAKHHGMAFHGEVIQRLAAGLDFIQAVAKDSGEVPMIGDADTGRATGWPLSDFWDFSWLMAAGAALLDRPSLFDGIEEFPAESFLLVGEEGLESFTKHKSGRVSIAICNELRSKATLPLAPPVKGGGFETLSPGGRGKGEGKNNLKQQSPNFNTAYYAGYDGQCSGDLLDFADGGYQISRDRQFSILFDVGPLGIPPGSGHGHADGLSFLLWHKGQSVVADTGTGMYNGPSLWRNYFRSTAAHNTIRIDGKNQTRPLDTFRWAEPLRIKREDPKIGESWRILRGALYWGGGIIHRRFIIHFLDCGVLVLDHIDGSGEHDLDWSLHFDPVWNVDEIGGPPYRNFSPSPDPFPKHREGASKAPSPSFEEGLGVRKRGGSFSAWTLNERLEVTIRQSSEANYSVLRGFMNPVAGWNSRYYGFRIPAPTLRATMRCQLPANILVKFTAPGEDIHAFKNIPEELFPLGVFDLYL